MVAQKDPGLKRPRNMEPDGPAGEEGANEQQESQFSSVQFSSSSSVQLFATPWTAARQASLSIHH